MKNRKVILALIGFLIILLIPTQTYASSMEPRGCYFVDYPEHLEFRVCTDDQIVIGDNVEKIELLKAPKTVNLIKTEDENIAGIKIYSSNKKEGIRFTGYVIDKPTDGYYTLLINDNYEIGVVYNLFAFPFTFYFWVGGIILMATGFLLFFFTKDLFQKLGYLLIGAGLCGGLLYSIPYNPIPFLILAVFAILAPVAIFLIKRNSKEAKWMNLIKIFIITIIVFILLKGFIF